MFVWSESRLQRHSPSFFLASKDVGIGGKCAYQDLSMNQKVRFLFQESQHLMTDKFKMLSSFVLMYFAVFYITPGFVCFGGN